MPLYRSPTTPATALLHSFDACLQGMAAAEEATPKFSVFAELARVRPLMHHVPYSLHNNFAELRAFVARLRPRAGRGIVKGGSEGRGCCIDPAVQFRGLLAASDLQHPACRAAARHCGAVRSWQVSGA